MNAGQSCLIFCTDELVDQPIYRLGSLKSGLIKRFYFGESALQDIYLL